MTPTVIERTEEVTNPPGPGPGGGGFIGVVTVPKSSPPPYSHAHFRPSLDSPASSPSTFTNTFLRGILTSIDSKDPVVANAWLETLLDAIDLLPDDIIKNDIIGIAINKAQFSQPVPARVSASRLIGKISTKLDPLTLQREVLPHTNALSQDVEPEVRHCMCRNLALVARGVGLESTKASVLPQLVELSNDENGRVRLASLETVVHLLSMLDDETCTQIIVPLVIKSCEQAKRSEDESLANVSHHLGRLCHGLTPNLTSDQKLWFIEFYKHLSKIGVNIAQEVTSGGGPMPDIVPVEDKTALYAACRRECAFNFPAFILFVEPRSFTETLYPTFNDLACDPNPLVRKTLAGCLHEVAKLIGPHFSYTKLQVCHLFNDHHIEVLEAMIGNLVHVIDALARFGVLQFGQSGPYSEELSAAMLKCEELVSQTRNWRLQADCLEKFSCLANCISPKIIQHKFVPMLFHRMIKARALPCRNAAARTLLVILRFTIKKEDKLRIFYRIQDDVAMGSSCHTRMLFLRLCEMAITLFSKNYFKQNFFRMCLALFRDKVANIRHKLCTMLPTLKSLIYLPSDKGLLQHLEATVKELLLTEKDRDVLGALQKTIEDLDRVEVGIDGVPSMNADEDRENERKLREERLITNMEEQINKINDDALEVLKKPTIADDSNNFSFSSQLKEMSLSETRRLRSESLPPSLGRNRLNGSSSSLQHSFGNQIASSKPRFNSPEPSQTFYDSVPLTPKESIKVVSFDPPSNGSISKHTYSASLENLDPSAKEFLVDAGVTLDSAKLISSSVISGSMPNLSNRDSDGRNGPPNFDGELSKFLISNREMEQYEVEYQKASAEISNQISRKQEPPSVKPTSQRPSRPESRLKPPSYSKFSSQPQKLDAVETTATTTTSTQSLPQRTGMPTLGSGSPSRFGFSSKLSSSTDKIQGSIERLAEKWEAKRKTLVENTTPTNLTNSSNSSEQSHSSRIAALEQKLNTIKQQNAAIARRSLLATSTGAGSSPTKRLSLTDQVGLVSRRFMMSKRKSLNADSITYNKPISRSGDSNSNVKMGEDMDIPDGPNHSNAIDMDSTYSRTELEPRTSNYPIPPPPAPAPPKQNISSYIVNVTSSSSSASLSSSSTIVTSASSTIPSSPQKLLSQPRRKVLPPPPRILPQIPSQSNHDHNNSNIRNQEESKREGSPLKRQIPVGYQKQNPPPYQRPPIYQKNPPLRQMNSSPQITVNTTADSGKVDSRPGSKFTRLPPPKYRPNQPPSQRRPLSHQDSSPSLYHSNRLNTYQNKSLSAECINVQESSNQLNSNFRPNLPSSDGNSTSSGSPSPQSSNSSNDFTQDASDEGGHIAVPVFNHHSHPRRSTGIRMFHGQQHHHPASLLKQRPNSAPENDNILRRRSPSPSLDTNSPSLLPPSRLRKPSSTSNVQQPQQRSTYHRNSYTGQQPQHNNTGRGKTAQTSPRKSQSRPTSPHALRQQSDQLGVHSPKRASGPMSPQSRLKTPSTPTSNLIVNPQLSTSKLFNSNENSRIMNQQQKNMYPQGSYKSQTHMFNSSRIPTENNHSPIVANASSSSSSRVPNARINSNIGGGGLPAPGFMAKQGVKGFNQRSM